MNFRNSKKIVFSSSNFSFFYNHLKNNTAFFKALWEKSQFFSFNLFRESQQSPRSMQGRFNIRLEKDVQYTPKLQDAQVI